MVRIGFDLLHNVVVIPSVCRLLFPVRIIGAKRGEKSTALSVIFLRRYLASGSYPSALIVMRLSSCLRNA
jgi:hypothetical protein